MPDWSIFIGYYTAMVCQGPVLAHLRQYSPEGFSPRANASEGVPIRARGIPQPCCNPFITYLWIVPTTQRVIKMLVKIEKGGNEKLSLKVAVYVLFSLGFYTCQRRHK